MFKEIERNHIERSKAVNNNCKAYEKILALRISIQKPLDLINKLPTINLNNEDNELSRSIQLVQNASKTVLIDSIDTLSLQCNKKRKRNNSIIDINSHSNKNNDLLWNEIIDTQNSLEEEKWSKVLNKWYARVHFGSEQVKSKMKVFNQSLWDQVNDILTDSHRCVAKSRMPLVDSKRIDNDIMIKNSNDNNNGDGIDSEEYDLEVYDDRLFYSTLLKTFITSAASSSTDNSTMRAEDIQALKHYKRKKSNVDRKASKGRKIRYTVHDKLQNFMFPIPHNNSNSTIDSEKLIMSLFQ